MKVTLRQRQKGNKISLYLDYYSNGKRDYEYLNLYLLPEPEKGKLTKAEK
ncbi:MAG TPA: site-specific integrase, partial [Flavobacterium sp.]|nr:site-specific integrase [Flavobacterium sp.]